MKNTVKINSVDLINADCLHFIQSLPDDSIDLIVTDPPYFKVKPNGWDNQWKGDEDYPIVFIGRDDRTKPISKESINQVIELLG